MSSSEKDLAVHTLPPITRMAFEGAVKLPLFTRNGWYLAGGTALALQGGHRQSVDLDFFTRKRTFRELAVERELLATDEWQTTFRAKGTIYGKFMGAKMSFIAYPFFVPAYSMIQRGNVRILTARDIAVMKIIAVSQRGRKRDFVDLYWYCTHVEPLVPIIERVEAQYPGQEHNLPHFIKSLTYFADADRDPMPKIFFKATWGGIKKFFQKEAVAATRKLILREWGHDW